MNPEEQATNAKQRSRLSSEKRRLLEQRLKRRAKPFNIKAPGIPHRPIKSTPLASLGQARIWVQDNISENSPSYNITSSFRIDSPIDTDALQFAFNEVIARHETLRSSYNLKDGDIIQHTLSTLILPLHRITVNSEGSLIRTAQKFGRKCFDMENGPLLHLALVSSSDSKHILILSIHDIIFDKWSLKLFWAEFSQFYRQAITSHQAEVPSLEIAYSDFSHWQRNWLKEGEQLRQTKYWREKLASPPPPIPFPTDFPYPETIGDPGALARAKLPAELTKNLRTFSAENNASLYTTLLLGFNLLLSRYSDCDDILVSSPVANRRKSETANLIGFFLNTLVIRANYSPKTSIQEALEKTKITIAEALDHQDLPTDIIAEVVKPPRNPGRQPLFQTMFVFQREDEGTPELELEGCEISPIFIETKTSKFELSLFVAENGDTLETIAEFRTDLFHAETIDRFLALYCNVLKIILKHPSLPVSEICLLTPQELATLRSFEKGPPLSLPDSQTILDYIYIHETNFSPAVVSTSQTLTYQQLAILSNSLAHALLNIGTTPHKPIAILQERTPSAIASILGILKSGAPYIVIEPDMPEERINAILEGAEVETVITSAKQANHSSIETLNTLFIDQIPDASEHESLPKPSPSQLAYIIFTSGSTGKPKGVAITHKNLLFSTLARLDYYGIDPLRFLLLPNLSFDSSVAGLFWTLATGGTLVIPDATELRDPDALCRIATSNQVQATLCVPTLYTQLLGWDPQSLNSLKKAIVAGEACSQSLVSQHYDCLPQCELFNEYGPTEATVWATVEKCDSKPGALHPVTIGRPISGTEIHILDNNLRRVPIGQVGQIHIAGLGLAQGYYNRTDITDQHFIHNQQGQRLYATGDQASWTQDGRLVYHGRTDDQIKIRGYRIEVGEIENALLAIPGVKQAAVIPVENPSNKSLEELVKSLPAELIETSLSEIDQSPKSPTRIVNREHFQIQLNSKSSEFINPPRKAQRDWLFGQALNELADDLERLHLIAPTFVPGKDHKIDSDLIDISEAALTHDQIMEDWQSPLMKVMAEYVTETHGSILEIGFGRGVSATFVQDRKPLEHTIIEMNHPCIENFFRPWRKAHSNSKINLLEGRWQDRLPELGSFDGILFHAFPMNEQEFMDYVLNSITFAEHAFEPMAQHLNPGGVFTYLTTEIESLSRRHQRALFQHFSEVTLKIVPINVPADTIDTWWANTMVAIKAVK